MSVASVLKNLCIERCYSASYISERTQIKESRIKLFMSSVQMPTLDELYKLAALPDCNSMIFEYLIQLDTMLPQVIKDTFQNKNCLRPPSRDAAVKALFEAVENAYWLKSSDDTELRNAAALTLVALEKQTA